MRGIHRLNIFILPLLLLLVSSSGNAQHRTIEIDFEIITMDAFDGDGGNAWGGHQCRIVRTEDGVFTIYNTGGEPIPSREWHLVKRTNHGWKELASGKSGREPVNLLASPDGTLNIIAYPDLTGTILSGKPVGESIELSSLKLPAVKEGTHPYNSASIDIDGNIFVVSSTGSKGSLLGEFRMAYYHADLKEWQGRVTCFDHRYCYTYIFPDPDKSVVMVSTRDVIWSELDYVQPPNTFGYVFNAVGVWFGESFDQPLERRINVEELPTQEYPYVYCHALSDVYMDDTGNIHIINTRNGESTKGVSKNFHLVYNPEGDLLIERELPQTLGSRCRLFQDGLKRLFVIGTSGWIYGMDREDFSVKDSVQLLLEDYEVEYSGYGLSVPRTGSPLSNDIDVVFPSHKSKYWVYFHMDMAELFPEEAK